MPLCCFNSFINMAATNLNGTRLNTMIAFIFKRFFIALLFSFTITNSYAQDSLILTTIKPIHSLVSAVVGQTADVDLLIDGTQSPHDFYMSPSDIRLINKADMFFYVDLNFEPYLSSALENAPTSVFKYALSEAPGIELLTIRDSDAWDNHSKEHHHHADNNDSPESQSQPSKHHHHGHMDYHFWLSPSNGLLMIDFIAESLIKRYPDNKQIYLKNARQYKLDIDMAAKKISDQLADFKDQPYFVFHDAYQYFEHYYDLNAQGSLTLNPEQGLSIKHARHIRQKIEQKKARCIFSEPQFDSSKILNVLDNSSIQLGILDPLGSQLTKGSRLYIQLLEQLSQDMAQCFSQ